ncbi:MAG: sarcosine oxidase subunit gamma [Burkholderiales bacterium]
MTASTDSRASPLAGWADRFAAASAEPARFAIREIAFSTQFNLRGNAADPAFADAASGALGFALPVAANTVSGTAERRALWLGPDEWLLTAPAGEAAAIEAALAAALRGVHHALVEVSASRTLIAISGSDARAVLAKGCALDLHAGAFGQATCAQTLLTKAQVILHCAGPGSSFHLYVRNSFADYLARWLTDAAAESSASQALDAARLAARLA